MIHIDEVLQLRLEELEQGQPLDKVLKRIPAEMEGLASLVSLAQAMRQMPHPKPAHIPVRELISRGNGRVAQPKQVWQWPRLGFAFLRATVFGVDNRTITPEMVTPFQTSGGAQVLAPNWAAINPILEEMFGE